MIDLPKAFQDISRRLKMPRKPENHLTPHRKTLGSPNGTPVVCAGDGLVPAKCRLDPAFSEIGRAKLKDLPSGNQTWLAAKSPN